jgi:hypothetical protein
MLTGPPRAASHRQELAEKKFNQLIVEEDSLANAPFADPVKETQAIAKEEDSESASPSATPCEAERDPARRTGEPVSALVRRGFQRHPSPRVGFRLGQSLSGRVFPREPCTMLKLRGLLGSRLPTLPALRQRG